MTLKNIPDGSVTSPLGFTAGAAAAALMIGIFAIPWAGMTAVAVGLAILQLAAIPTVFIALRGR